MVDLSQLAAQAQPQQPPPGYNDPGGPAPDPRTLPVPQTPSPSVDQLLPQRPVKTSREQPDQQQADAGDGDGGTPLIDTQAGQTPQMYIPHQADRPPDQWGKPSFRVSAQQSYDGVMTGSDAPSPTEAPPMIASAGGALGQWGSPGVAGPASMAGSMARRFFPILDLLSSGQFSKNYNTASLNRMKMEMQMTQLNIERAYMAHQQEMLNYGSIFHEAALGAITPEQAKYRLEHHIYLNNDAILNEILQNKGLGSAEKFLQWRDAQMNNLLAGGTTMRKASGVSPVQTNSILSEFGEPTTASSIDFPDLPDNKTRFASSAQSDADQQQGPRAFDDQYGQNLQKQQGLTDEEYDLASSIIGGDTPDSYANLRKLAPHDPNGAGKVLAKVDRAVNSMNADINRAVLGDDDSSTKLDRIAKINPKLADLERSLTGYRADPNKDFGTAHDRRKIIALAHQIDRNYNTDNFRIAQKYKDENSREGLVVQRVGALTGTLYSLNSALLKLPEDQKIPVSQIEDLIADRFNGDPRWKEAYSAIRNVAQEVAAIESGTGQPKLGMINNLVRHMMETGSPAQIRSQILIDVRAAHGYLKPIQDEWRIETNNPTGNLPFYSPNNEKVFDAYLRFNPYTGVMPADAPPSLLAAGRQQPKTFPSWLQRTTPQHPGQDLPPLTIPQIKQGWDKLDELTKKGDPDSLRQAQWLRERLGYFADRGSID